jgi:hypothetical protein
MSGGNRGNNKGGGNKSTKPPALEFNFNAIQKGDLQANYAPEAIIKSIVDGAQMVHAKTLSPKAPGAGDYRICFPSAMMISNILYNEYISKETGEVGCSLKVFMDMHGDYDIKNAQGQPTTCAEGFEMIEAIQNIERLWCESVDENPTYKKLLLAPLRFGASLPQKLAQPLSEWFLTSQVKRPTIEDEGSEDNGMPDMSKGEVVKFSLWVGRPTEENRNNASNVMIGETGVQLFCKIYDHTQGIAEQPLKHWSQIKKFVYTKGESKTGGRRPFRMQAVMVCLAPSMFANSTNQKGELQFKICELHIFAFDYKTSTFTLPETRKRSIMDEMIRSRDRFTIQREKPVEEPVDYEGEEQLLQQQQQQQNKGQGDFQPNRQRAAQTHMRYDSVRQCQIVVDADGNEFDVDGNPLAPVQQQQQQQERRQPPQYQRNDNNSGRRAVMQQPQQHEQHEQGSKRTRDNYETNNAARNEPNKKSKVAVASAASAQPQIRFDDDLNAYVRVDADGNEEIYNPNQQQQVDFEDEIEDDLNS